MYRLLPICWIWPPGGLLKWKQVPDRIPSHIDACIRQKVQEWSYDLLLEARGSPSSVLGPVNKSSQERLTPDRYHSSQQEGWPPPCRISGQGMENLWGRLQMLHFLIWVVVTSLFANVKFHRAVCALRLVHITICKVCLSKK